MVFENKMQQRRGGFSPPLSVIKAMGRGKPAPTLLHFIFKDHKPTAKFGRRYAAGKRQTSSGERNVDACRLSDRFNSFMDGGSGRITPCGPAIQLNGRRSFPTACWSSVSPSINALGLGGHPGT